MVLYINPANHAPGVKNGPALGVISSHRLTVGKTKENLLLQNHKAQSFHILSVAMYSGHLYKSCQPGGGGGGVKNGPALGVISSHRLTVGKTKENLLLRNHKAQSFHILFVAMYSGPLYKSCQPCPWGPYGPRHVGVMGKT